jgi:mannose-6-phosphate isomerase-like protein (cupin superfamily)
MADVTVKRLEEFEAVFGGGMRRVRAGLGVSSFGMQVMELPPEEVYLALGGRATLQVGEETFELEPGVFARVGPGQQRKLLTGEEGARILVLGATPGKIYEPPAWTEEGGALPPMPGKEQAPAA